MIYTPELFWKKRFEELPDLRGGGHFGRNNVLDYKGAEEVIKDVFSIYTVEKKLPLSNYQILDIGCANGYWTEFLKQNGVIEYDGIDITEVFFDELNKKYPVYNFIKQDITREPIQRQYDIILCLDVEQHIVDNELWKFAMRNIKQALRPDGVLLITCWCSELFERVNYYEVKRPLSFYKERFKNIRYPTRYRDKYLLQVFND